MKLFAIVLLLAALGAPARPQPPKPAPQEGAAAACDNNRQGKSKSVDHTCECAHATHCDPNSDEDRKAHEEMGPNCKTYCAPDHCKCTNECD